MINFLKDVYNIPEEYQYRGTIYPDDIFIDKFSFRDHNGKENIYLFRKGKESLKIVSHCDNILELFQDSFEFNNFIEKEGLFYKKFKEHLENEFESKKSTFSTKPSKGGWRNFYSRKNLFYEYFVRHDESHILGEGSSYSIKNSNFIDLTSIDEKEALFMILRIYARDSISIPNERFSNYSLRRITHVEYKNNSLIIFEYVGDYSINYIYMLLQDEEGTTHSFDKIVNVRDSIDGLFEDYFHFESSDEKKEIKEFFKYFEKEVYPGNPGLRLNQGKLREFEKDGNTYNFYEYSLKKLIHDLYFVSKLKGASENE